MSQEDFLNDIITTIEATPDMLSSWLGNLDAKQLLLRENPEAWDNITIIKHFIFGEQTDWIPRLNLMADHTGQDPVKLEPFDMKGHESNPEQNIQLLLAQFKSEREKSIEALKVLAKENNLLDLKAIHPSLGEVSGEQLLAAWPAHDLTHIYQIARNLASPYKIKVGPWKKFIRILRA